MSEERVALVTWSRTSSPCPVCGLRDVVDVRQVFLEQEPGTYSLAGMQDKAAARVAWVYRCSSCGADGPAEPKESSGAEA